MASTNKKAQFKTDLIADINDDVDSSPTLLGEKPKSKNPFTLLFQGGFCPPKNSIDDDDDDDDMVATNTPLKSSLRNKSKERSLETDKDIVKPLIVSPSSPTQKGGGTIHSPSEHIELPTKTKAITEKDNINSIQISERTIKFIVEKSWGFFVCTCILAIIIAKLGLYERLLNYISSKF